MSEVFREMDRHFDELYCAMGRGTIPPERVLGAKVLMALYSVRSERQFCERLQYDLLFQWFLDINPDEPQACFDATVFTKNAPRLLAHQTTERFFGTVVELARRHGWVSNEHFSVDGSLIEAWASMKSFRPKDEPGDGPGGGNRWQDFHGEKRRNDTHQSTTDPEARLVKNGVGREAKLSFALHAGMENRNGLCVALTGRQAAGPGTSESQVGAEVVAQIQARSHGIKTVGADKGYHSEPFVNGCRQLGVTAHPAVQRGREVTGVDESLTASEGYRVSQIVRRRIEEIFGWVKTIGGLRKSRYRGVARTNLCAQIVAGTYNLVRMAKLILSPPPSSTGA